MKTLCINGHWAESTENLYGCPHCPQNPTAKTTKRPYANATSKRRSVTVNESNWNSLKQIGQGNASEGIRRLLREGVNK